MNRVSPTALPPLRRLAGLARPERLRDACLLAVLAAALGWLLFAAAGLAGDLRQNRALAAMAGGREIRLADSAASTLLAARGSLLLQRGRLDEAQAIVDGLAAQGPDAAPEAHALLRYNLGNARMRAAFALIDSGAPEKAIPLVVLAKRDYRQAAGLAPGDWDVKYNLDLAMRMVRDFPALKQGEGDTLPASRRLWPDLPGTPNGLP